VLLIAVLIGWYVFPREVLSGLPFGARASVGTLLVVLPLFFAGIVFATSFAKRKNASLAFGSNLIGAVIGGAAEAASIAWGIRSLTLLALAFYVASWIAHAREH
jgi:membrane-bound acyltransferase YfiQ involved in biofilm formation